MHPSRYYFRKEKSEAEAANGLCGPSVPVSKKGQIAAKESSSSSFLHVFERLCTKVPSDREAKVAAFRHQRGVPHPNQRPFQGVAFKAFCHGGITLQ